MRSSIACARCRRSKVKCLNNGVNTPCRACNVAGRECIYPSPATGERTHRRDGSIGGRDQGLPTPDVPRSVRSKPKKSMSQYFGLQSNRALVDALDPTVLTPQVWLDLFEIWQRHFAIDLPFIHPPSFVKLLSQAHGASSTQDFATPKSEGPNELPAAPAEFLLAFLALTSRFHPGLVAHHSPGTANRPSNPLFAAEYYAGACKNKLIQLSDALGLGGEASRLRPDTYRVQAYLMLAFHEWGDCQGTRAWELIGMAIRYAHLTGLNYQEDIEASFAKNLIVRPVNPETLTSGTANTEVSFREQESRRRTFWSCFILERCLSSGRFMPLTLRAEDVRIQLPASDRAFLFNEKVRTALLSDSVEEKTRSANGERLPTPSRIRDSGDPDATWESGPYEGLVSRYVKAAEAYNAVVQWACRGGRLNEKYPPWDSQSTWHSLYRQVNSLIEKLPRDLALSQANISAHITSRTSAPFTLLHTVLLLSKMILHREFLPFFAVQGTYPKGPSDNHSPFMATTQTPESTFSFWGESASELFKSARELLNLFLSCTEWKVLVETPLVGFASYMIAVLGIYSVHFPWMDPKEYMSTNPASAQGTSGFLGLFAIRDADAARKACDLVALFRPKLRMAEGWFKTLGKLHRLYLRTKKELRRNFKYQPFGFNGPYQGRTSLLPLRMQDEQYKPLDTTFGRSPSPSLSDAEMTDAPHHQQKDERTQATEGAARDAWAAVNNIPPAPVTSNQAQPSPSNGSSSAYPQPSPAPSSSAYPTLSPTATQHPYTPSAPSNIPYTPGRPKSPLSSATTAHHVEPSIETPPSATTPATTAPPRSTPLWTLEQVDAWLGGLETVFGAQDVAAFVEAVDWRNFGSPSALVQGWLRVVWMSGSRGH